ncbi:non-ribosomal peptide synthetase, partial [Micromonospora echinofusca]
MSVGFDGARSVAGAVDAGTLDLVGDLRQPTVWPARAASVHRVLPSWLPDVGPAADVVLAGLVAVLARWTAQEEIVLGLSSGDGGSVLRVDVAGDPGFGELTARVGAALAEPVALGAGVVGPVVVGVVDGPVAVVGPGVVGVDLVVSVASDASAVRVDYAVEGFSGQWVRGLVDQVVVLVSAGLAGSGLGVSGLPLVGDAER